MVALTDLPVEILDQVCILLCSHCQPYTIKISKPSISDASVSNSWETDRIERIALRSLCLTSKYFRNVAQPVLFHGFFHHRNLNWQNPQTELIPRLCLLLRTIGEHPRLAGFIKYVDIKAFEEKCTCCYHIAERATTEQDALVIQLAKKTGLSFDTSYLDSDSLPEVLIQLLLALSPNLLQLNLCIPRWWTFQPLATSALGRGHQGMSSFLHQVKQMELEIENHDNDTCFHEHDEEWCIHPTPPSPVERLLVDSAPNLELLSCTAGALDSLPSRPKLRWLQIQMKGSWEGMLPQLMRGLPRLTHFSYITGNEHCPTPKEIQDSLVGHRNTLEYLNVVQQRWMSLRCDDWKPGSERPYAMTSLAEFTVLKTINLDGYMIWPNRDGGATFGEVDSDLQLLPKFLPQCVQQLHVDGWDNYEDENFRSLAKAVANGRFPQLEAVIWGTNGICHFGPDTADRAWDVGKGWRTEVPNEVVNWMELAHYHAFPDWKAEWFREMAK